MRTQKVESKMMKKSYVRKIITKKFCSPMLISGKQREKLSGYIKPLKTFSFLGSKGVRLFLFCFHFVFTESMEAGRLELDGRKKVRKKEMFSTKVTSQSQIRQGNLQILVPHLVN